jgi:large subunit ribosomal protein L6
MLKIKKKIKQINKIYFKNSFCNIKIFFIDNFFIINKNIKINVKNNKIYFKSKLGILYIIFNNNLLFFIKNNKLLLNINILNKEYKKKKFLNLYIKLIKIKIKGILQKFKLILIMKGLNFKNNIKNNKLLLKLGFSHYIIINIPNNIKIINKQNKLIFYSINYIYLIKFIFFLKNLKKLNCYKEKGLLFQNEKFFKKEGKKNKK